LNSHDRGGSIIAKNMREECSGGHESYTAKTRFLDSVGLIYFIHFDVVGPKATEFGV